MKSLIEEYRSSRSQNSQTPFLSGDEQIIYRFLKQVMELYWKSACDKLEEFSDRSPSAMIFQRKFHKRLFLEPPGGAVLSQVYIAPHCWMNQKWMECAYDAVNEFLQSSTQNFLIIEGAAGSGKSSFLAALSERYDSSEYIFVSLKDLLKESDTIQFRSALLQECGLSNLEGIRFKDCILKSISFAESTLNNVYFQNVYINKCIFKQADMDGVTFSRTTFVNCDFSELPAACGCVFSQCEIDIQTQETNPELFKAKRVFPKKRRNK